MQYCKSDKKYTWFRRKPKLSASRIDYFLISDCLMNKTGSAEIHPCTLSDHSSITIQINTESQKRGPGMWRFNNTLLNNDAFIEMMSLQLNKIKDIYGYYDPVELWEILKSEAVSKSKLFSKSKAKSDKLYRCNLYKTLANLQEEMVCTETCNSDFEKSYLNLQAAIDASLENDAKKSAFMCKTRYIKDGERSSKYFFGLNKREYVNKTMYRVRLKDGTITKDYREILNAQKNFYEELYCSNTDIKFNITNNSGIFLSNEQKLKLEEPVQMEEIWSALSSMKADKAPGLDGLTKEFYVKFYEQLKEPLYRLYLTCFRTGCLNLIARVGVIQLIPKRNRCDLEVKNWRPLTLLNLDYKVIARVIALRMELVMDALIGPQQTGFMKDRHISHNILRTQEILGYMTRHQQQGVIISIDFEKCFDRIEYRAIRGSLKYFNFGEEFIRWVSLLFKSFSICTKNNGHFSELFRKTRGVNQGCPASPSLYNLSGEIMSHLIQENSNIKGISIYNIKNILSQFADDTAIYTKYDKLSVENICKTLTRVEENIGLKISYEKTNMYRIGSLYKSEARLYTSQNLCWTSNNIDMLGVTLACNGQYLPSNYESIYSKVQAVCDNWYNKTSTLSGKILVINSLMGSLFVYKMTTLVNMTENQIKKVEVMIHDFLWNGRKRGRISMNTLTKDRKQGGLRLVDLRAKQKSIKIKWIFTIEKDPFLTQCMHENLDPNMGMTIFECNLSKIHVKKCFGYDNSLWIEILEGWCEINYHAPSDKTQIRNEILWYNSNLLLNNNPLYSSNGTKRVS